MIEKPENIISIIDVLRKNLDIPNYQRPYRWKEKNVIELLDDINNAISDSRNHSNFKYRIGTIILYENSDEQKLEIIDGQQRLITLSLIYYYLNENSFNCSLLKIKNNNIETQKNLYNNYQCIKNWFSLRSQEYKEEYKNAFFKILEVVVLTVNNLSEAFQLFDSQNTRGKELDPHDLLKAYHLREMQDNKHEMFHSVEKWESFKPNDINNLFRNYLYPILKWARKEKAESFSVDQIDYYKGISSNRNYTYAKRTEKAAPYFQITEPFISGIDFFEMVSHYLVILKDIDSELKNNDSFKEIREIMGIGKDNNSVNYKSIGFNYACDLFKCALLCYYDRFHIFDEQAVKNLFLWAFMIRVDMENLGYETVNKYASGEFDYYKYTNNIPMFSKIVHARFHTDISNLTIKVKRGDKDNDHAKSKKWDDLYIKLKKYSGLEK